MENMARYDTILLDLDDTVYPSTVGLWHAVGDRINAYMMERLGISAEQTSILRAAYLKKYGTTLNGLIAHHQADPYDYLNFVHDVHPERYLHPNPALKEMLARLPQKRVIFTNASAQHARRVLQLLGIEDQIDLIVDILTLELINKPKPEAYRRALAAAEEKDPTRCVLLDDRLDNLLPGVDMGMTTVLVGNTGSPEQVTHCIHAITDLVDAIPSLLEP
jgi:putative hydrolase of the HAD superfamily